MTWLPGRDRVTELLNAGELEQVAADQRIAQRLLDDADRHLATAATALSLSDLSGGYQLAYDALRKSAASLLAVQGLRATSRGRHVAVQEAVLAQFGSSVAHAARRRRHGEDSIHYDHRVGGNGPDLVAAKISANVRFCRASC